MAYRMTITPSGLPWLDKLRRDIARQRDMRRPFSPRHQLVLKLVLNRDGMDEDLHDAIEAAIAYIDALHDRILPSTCYTATFRAPAQSWPSVYVSMAPTKSAAS